MSMMDNIDAFPDLEQNYRRGLGLLRLAAEQVCNHLHTRRDGSVLRKHDVFMRRF